MTNRITVSMATDGTLSVLTKNRDRHVTRKVTEFHHMERWTELLAAAKKSRSADGRLRSLIYEYHAAIRLDNPEEIERCKKLLAEIKDAEQLIKYSASLVKWKLPVQAAEILASLPWGFQSSVATKLARRIQASSRDKLVRRKVRRFIVGASTDDSATSVIHRYPNDLGDVVIPGSRIEVVRGSGVDPKIEALANSLVARSAAVLRANKFPFVKEYKNVRVTKLGQISPANGELGDANDSSLNLSDSSSVPVFDEAFICAGKHKGYFEWIVRRLSSLSWYLEPGTPKCPILLRKEHWNLAVDALGALCVPKERMVVIDGPVLCRRLYDAHVPMSTLIRKPAFERAYGDLIRAAERLNTPPMPSRFYISRRDSARRSIADEAAFEKEMIARGIAPLVLSELGLLEKINLFRNAELAIGAHGAGFSHLVFAKPGMRVIEITPTSLTESKMLGVQTCFTRLSAMYGHHHTFMLQGMDPVTSEWSPDIADIDRVLAAG
ncbi:glycosyltransferase family 61 protein [Methylobacterium sp. CM6241]